MEQLSSTHSMRQVNSHFTPPLLLQILYQKSTDKLKMSACCFSTLPGNAYACLTIGRQVHVYDYLERKLLFKLNVGNVRRLVLVDKEEILVVLETFGGRDEDEGQVKLYSIKVQAYQWKQKLIDKELAFTKEAKTRKNTLLQKRAHMLSQAKKKEINEEEEFKRQASKVISTGPKTTTFTEGDDEEQPPVCKIMVSTRLDSNLCFRNLMTESERYTLTETVLTMVTWQ